MGYKTSRQTATLGTIAGFSGGEETVNLTIALCLTLPNYLQSAFRAFRQGMGLTNKS